MSLRANVCAHINVTKIWLTTWFLLSWSRVHGRPFTPHALGQRSPKSTKNCVLPQLSPVQECSIFIWVNGYFLGKASSYVLTLPATQSPMDSTSSIFFDMFDTLIRPILTYGSDVWGLSKAGLDVLDKVFLNFVRCTLNVKATTCNAIVYGECGRYPLSVFCHINVLCYLHRLLTMPGERIIKSVFHTLGTLHGQGFTTWATKA